MVIYNPDLLDGEENDDESEDDPTYRAYCTNTFDGRVPGCGWERLVETEKKAQKLVQYHSTNWCEADYEMLGSGDGRLEAMQADCRQELTEENNE